MATCGNDKFLFIHVPKTGGNWVNAVFQMTGIQVQPESGQTPHHPPLSELDRRGRFTFAFVREPLSWYGSFWQFRNYHLLHKDPAHAGHPCDPFVGLDFPDFIEKVVEHLPGFLSGHYAQFVGRIGQEIDFIGRYENLEDDLVFALRTADQDFKEETVRSLPPINVTAPHPDCPQETRLRLMQSESRAYERFYKAELATSSGS